MKADIEHLKYFQETTSGFLTITEKRKDSMDSRVIANTANSMRNSIVKRSRPEAQRALHDKHTDDVKNYRDTVTSKADKVKYYFTPTQLIVNEVPHEDDLKNPTYKEMVNLDFRTLHEMHRIEFYSSMPKVVK